MLKTNFIQKISTQNALTFVIGTITLIALAWLGDQSYFLFYDHTQFKLSATLYSLTVFLLGSLIIAILAFDFVKVRSLSTGPNKKTNIRVLIAAVSTLPSYENMKPSDKLSLKEIEKNGIKKFILYKGDEEKLTFTDNINQDIQMLDQLNEDSGIKLNWQQTLRCIKPHITTLEKVVLIYSEQMKENKIDDLTELETMIKWLSRYANNPCGSNNSSSRFTVVGHHKAVNKDEMDDYYDAFNDQINSALAQKVNGKQIIVDVTGGQVPASIGASLSTLHNLCMMQYVNTDGDEITYNAEIIRVGS